MEQLALAKATFDNYILIYKLRLYIWFFRLMVYKHSSQIKREIHEYLMAGILLKDVLDHTESNT